MHSRRLKGMKARRSHRPQSGDNTTSQTSSHAIFPGATDFSIHDTTFNVNTQSDTRWMELLQAHTSTGAFHDSDDQYDAPQCHPHTREVVLREIMDWVRNVDHHRHRHRSTTRSATASPNVEPQRFLWIYGPAGSGKSSIARSIAIACKKLGILASDFFFSRTVAGRNSHVNLVPTLACQHTTSIPETRTFVAEAIDQDALIFSRSLEIQLEQLLVRPFMQVVEGDGSSSDYLGNNTEYPYPYLIIIDGLDECGTPENQSYVLSSLSAAFEKSTMPFIFLIASRSEMVIRDAFNGKLHPYTRRIFLDNKYKPDKDIRLFLNDKFAEIRRRRSVGHTHGLPDEWPAPSNVDSIVQKASGQFIYASTVMKFIGSRGILPTEALDIVLSLVSSLDSGNDTESESDELPFVELDALYARIFLFLKKKTLDKALTALAFILIDAKSKFSYATPKMIEHWLGYKPGELAMVLVDLHSVVDVPVTPTGEIRLFHASLADFLQDRSRSKELFIDAALYSARFARIATRRLTPLLEGYTNDVHGTVLSHFTRYRKFLALFDYARDDRDLLTRLGKDKFPIENFFNFVFSSYTREMHKRDAMLYHLESFLRWIQRQDYVLYNVYIRNLDDYLKSRIVLDSFHPRWKNIFTALTLYGKVAFDNYHLNDIQILDDDVPNFVSHFFSARNYQDSEMVYPPEFVLSRLTYLLRDPSLARSGMYFHVNILSYVDLAIGLFDSLVRPMPTDSATMHDNMRRREIAAYLLGAALKQIPGERRMGQYLQSKKETGYMTFTTLPHVEEYLKTCEQPSMTSKKRPSGLWKYLKKIANILVEGVDRFCNVLVG